MHRNFKKVKLKTTIKSGFVCLSLLLVVAANSWASTAKLAIGPDNNQAALLAHLRSAADTLVINIYLFDNPEIAKVLIDRIKNGVTVQMLVEGQPFGQIPPNGKQILSAVRAAMAESGNPAHRLFIMSKPDNGAKRRYRYNHAKYVIADRQNSLISSENFTDSGHAKPGTVGNRGWDVAVDDSRIAGELQALFDEDADPRFGDVKRLPVTTDAPALPQGKAGKLRSVTPFSFGKAQVQSSTLITSPNAAHHLVALINAARESISIEHMSLPLNWRAPNAGQNPVVTALIHAAQRGVNVRVLLNDEAVFGRTRPPANDSDDDELPAKKGNELTVSTLNTIGESESIPLRAEIVNVKSLGISYIHNKGIIVDDKQVLISSINGSQNSVVNNREVAILLNSPSAASYYEAVFNFDWQFSVKAKGGTDRIRPCINLENVFSRVLAPPEITLFELAPSPR